MKLLELFTAVRDDKLSKDQLENFHKQMSELSSEMLLEEGRLKKLEAMFMVQHPELSGKNMERKWGASEEGQMLIEMKASNKAMTKQLNSLKVRLYSTY